MMKNMLSKPEFFNTVRNYSAKQFSADLMAGIIVGIVALPLAIAFGIASGVSPEKGIVTAIVAGFIISFLGGTKVQIGGPTGAFIVIIYGIVNNPEYGLAGLTVATILAGVLLILLGLFKLGAVIKFIPYPIIIGFTAGIALTIFTTQMGDVLGLTQTVTDAAGNIATVPLKTPGDFIGKWVCYFQNIDTFNLWNFIMAVLSIVIIAGLPRLLRRVPVLNKIPGSLYGIIIVTLLVLVMKNCFGISDIDTIGDRFKIQASLPAVEVPSVTWAMVQKLMPVAFTIAILGAIESLLSAAVADGVIGDHHNSNSELIAQGVANMITPLFGGIPATGAIARTMTNINNGGRTPVAGIIHAVVLLLILLVLMPLAEYIPMAALAGVLVVVSYNMSGWRSVRGLLKSPKSDVATLVVTFILTVVFDLTIAIEVGLVIAAVVFVKRVMETTEINVVKDELNSTEDVRVRWHQEQLTIPHGTEVYEINGPYFFGIANKFEETMSKLAGPRPKVRIIRMRKITFMDSTGIHNLQTLIEMSHQDGIQVILSGVSDKVRDILMRNGFEDLLGSDNICANINIAIERAKVITKK